jgi:hypothetical protein
MSMRADMALRQTAAILLVAFSIAVAGVTPPGALRAAEPAMELKWHQLVPPAPPKPPKSLLANRPVDLGKLGGPNDGSPAPPPLPEGRWMSMPAKSGDRPAPVVASLDGKRVHIGGYIVPLDFDATRVKEFLLVPFVGACIHVPPPPANQIVYVKTEAGFDVQGTFDPVWVTGILKVTTAFTGLAEAGYSLEAEKVESRPRG